MKNGKDKKVKKEFHIECMEQLGFSPLKGDMHTWVRYEAGWDAKQFFHFNYFNGRFGGTFNYYSERSHTRLTNGYFPYNKRDVYTMFCILFDLNNSNDLNKKDKIIKKSQNCELG